MLKGECEHLLWLQRSYSKFIGSHGPLGISDPHQSGYYKPRSFFILFLCLAWGWAISISQPYAMVHCIELQSLQSIVVFFQNHINI